MAQKTATTPSELILPSTSSVIRVSILLLMCMHLCFSSAHSKLHKAPNDVRVPHSYFVHLDSHCLLDIVDDLIEELKMLNDNAERPLFKAEVSQILTQAGYGFSAKLSGEALQHVLDHEAVLSVEEDQYISAGESSEIIRLQLQQRPYLWGIDELDGVRNNSFIAPCNLTGRGVDVYVLDSGVAYDHEHFGGRVEYPNCDPADWQFNEDQNGSDCHGHGSAVAGIIGSQNQVGVAIGVTLLPVRVLNCSGIGSMNSILNGLECILRHSQNSEKPAVVNVSIFGKKSSSIKRAVESLLRNKITVVAISGNAWSATLPNDACKVYPSSIQGVITVSAHTVDKLAFNRTNMGTCVDIFAPGHNVESVSIDCPYCTEVNSGSSVAAPYVTGAVALLLEKCPKLSPWKVKYHLLTSLSVVDDLIMPRSIPRRFRRTTPNIRLKVDRELCSLEC